MSESNLYAASVVICVRNGADTIARQLRALDRQINADSFEVIIVDNGSTDGTLTVVQEWIDREPHAASLIRVVDAGPTPGIPRARNIGAREAQGRIIAFCDADDEVGDEWLASFITALESDALAGGGLTPVTVDGMPWPGTFGDGLPSTSYLPHVGNCNCAMTRTLFFAVGGYDESLPRYGFEDVELSWRVQEAGYPLLYVPDARIRFTVSASTASISKRFYLGQGRMLMAQRFPNYDPTEYSLVLVARQLFRDAVALAKVVIRDRHVDRKAAGQLVAGAGRFVGVLKYKGSRAPQRRGVTGD